jgi:predicted nucleic acid-binding protein
MLVIADTSALLALAVCDAVEILDRLFTDVRVPPAVHREIVVPGRRAAEVLGSYLRDRVADVDLSEYVIAGPGLGRGELEAMALYRKLSADRLLVDDVRARKVARFNGMHVVGSLGVLLTAKQRGHLDAIAPCVNRLRASEIYFGAALLQRALELAGEA